MVFYLIFPSPLRIPATSKPVKHMKVKKLLATVFGRTFVFGLAIVLQLAWLLYTVTSLSDYSKVINVLLTILSLLAVIYIINSPSNPAVKMAWIVPILVFPLFGGIIFLISGGHFAKRKLGGAITEQHTQVRRYLPDSTATLKEIGDSNLTGQCRYLVRQDFPVYTNTQAEYYPVGEAGFDTLLHALEKAEKFIFMEYFIIAPGKMWDSILEILIRKAAEGVDVRLIYDDMGSISTLPFGYANKLRKYGIKTIVFNPFVPLYSTVMNNRDHRKITVIDGNVGFTGGINFADEYINELERFGHWKDTWVKLEGDGVWGLTTLFLETWNALKPTDGDLGRYRPTKSTERDGFVLPYGDSPLDHENLGENVYLNMINGAKKYVYIMTPYLIIDQDMQTALCLAAKRGVDVRILTPGIPDKKIVFSLTRAHYPELIQAGVRIYEYTPGFLHAKSILVDDEAAVVGTINMDYRSLYLHFENACLFVGGNVISQVKDDFLETQTKSRRIRWSDIENGRTGKTLLHSIYYAFLRLFAPLL